MPLPLVVPAPLFDPLLLVPHIGYGGDPPFAQRYPNDQIAPIPAVRADTIELKSP